MDILKFDESGTSSPSRKRSGRGAILVTFVALVFGAGTALASGTLAINTNNEIALDQGVANSVQCDTDITVSLKTGYDVTSTDFVYTGVDISGINGSCEDKYFTIHTYDQAGNKVVFCNPDPTDAGCQTDGDAAKLQVSGTTLNYVFSRALRTGELRGTPGSETNYVLVKTVTVESSDS